LLPKPITKHCRHPYIFITDAYLQFY